MDDALAHRLEERSCARESRVRAAGHESQRARLSAADAARDRRIERQQPGARAHLMRSPRTGDVDGRRIDNQGAPGDGRQDFRPTRQHMLAGRQHSDDNLRPRDRRRRARGNRDALGGRFPLRALDQVVAADAMARLCEIGRHRAAHIAKANERDIRHRSLRIGAADYCASRPRATITRMISLVPSSIWCTRRSRTIFSTPYSAR